MFYPKETLKKMLEYREIYLPLKDLFTRTITNEQERTTIDIENRDQLNEVVELWCELYEQEWIENHTPPSADQVSTIRQRILASRHAGDSTSNNNILNVSGTDSENEVVFELHKYGKSSDEAETANEKTKNVNKANADTLYNKALKLLKQKNMRITEENADKDELEIVGSGGDQSGSRVIELRFTKKAQPSLNRNICILWSHTRIKRTFTEIIVPNKTRLRLVMGDGQVGTLRTIKRVQLVLNPKHPKHPSYRIIDNYMNTKTKTDPEMMFRITLQPVKQRGSKAKKNVAT